MQRIEQHGQQHSQTPLGRRGVRRRVYRSVDQGALHSCIYAVLPIDEPLAYTLRAGVIYGATASQDVYATCGGHFTHHLGFHDGAVEASATFAIYHMPLRHVALRDHITLRDAGQLTAMQLTTVATENASEIALGGPSVRFGVSGPLGRRCDA